MILLTQNSLLISKRKCFEKVNEKGGKKFEFV
jgi:hypothetical protein